MYVESRMKSPKLQKHIQKLESAKLQRLFRFRRTFFSVLMVKSFLKEILSIFFNV